MSEHQSIKFKFLAGLLNNNPTRHAGLRSTDNAEQLIYVGLPFNAINKTSVDQVFSTSRPVLWNCRKNIDELKNIYF
jgi:hypothetical protein